MADISSITLPNGSSYNLKDSSARSDKIDKSIGTAKGDLIIWSSSGAPERLGIGTNGQVLKVVSDTPAWASDNNTDTKVRQTLKSDNVNRPLLMAYSNTSTTTGNVDNVSYRNNSIYANASNGTITATNFSGKINNHTVEKDVPSDALFTDTTYESKSAASGGTDLSLVTTGEKATWNAKTSNTGTITGIKMNGASKGTSGVVDLGTVITAHQDISGKLNTSLKGAANGLAELDENGKVPSSQLPSYVDDVLEYNAKSNFPATGETGKIYVDTTTNLTYRWSGSAYVEISASLALGTTSSTAYRGDYGASAYAHAVTNKGSAFSNGLYKITTNGEGHVTAATEVVKADITDLGIPGSDTNTHRPIKVNGTEILGNNTTALNLKAGSNVTVTNSSGTVTIAATDTTYSDATTSTHGLMSTTDKSKLDGIESGAEVNQNAFTKVTVGSTNIEADSKTDTLVFVAGSNVTLTPDATNDKITIAATDTTYESKSAASGGKAVSLVTTGEKYTWNNKLGSHQTIKQDGITGATINRFATCSTADTTQEKTVSIEGITALETGLFIRVLFQNRQYYNGVPTLNVNNLGAKNIRRISGVNAARYEWQAGEVLDLVYNGTYWIIVDGGVATTAYYGVTKLSESATGTYTTMALTPSSLNNFWLNLISNYSVYSSSSTYAVGDRVRYSYNVWECKTAITEAEAWTASHWTKLSTLLDMIEARIPNVYEASLPIESWVGNEAPYSFEKTVTGILASDKPVIDVMMSGTYSTDMERQEAWSHVYRAVTSANKITFYANEKPTVNIPVQILCTR